jgi:hypothetical protein
MRARGGRSQPTKPNALSARVSAVRIHARETSPNCSGSAAKRLRRLSCRILTSHAQGQWALTSDNVVILDTWSSRPQDAPCSSRGSSRSPSAPTGGADGYSPATSCGIAGSAPPEPPAPCRELRRCARRAAKPVNALKRARPFVPRCRRRRQVQCSEPPVQSPCSSVRGQSGTSPAPALAAAVLSGELLGLRTGFGRRRISLGGERGVAGKLLGVLETTHSADGW